MQEQTARDKFLNWTTWMKYRSEEIRDAVEDGDLDKIASQFGEMQMLVQTFQKELYACYRRLDYGEEWDQ